MLIGSSGRRYDVAPCSFLGTQARQTGCMTTDPEDLGPDTVVSDRQPINWRAVAGTALQLSAFVLAFALLREAADHDKHFYASGRRGVGQPTREGAGLFLAAGVMAAVPAFAALALKAPRWRTIAAAIIIMSVAVVCEFVVTVAPEPWFTF